MAVSTAMSPIDIRSKIQAAAVRFSEQLVAVFGEALTSVASDLTAKTATKAKPPAVKRTPAKKAPTRKVASERAKTAASKRPRKAAKATRKAAKPAPKPPAAKNAQPAKRIRRSGAQLAADAQRVVKLLEVNKKGLRIEQINKQLGTAAKALARPIQNLLDDGKIKKTGEKRGTLYFPA